MKKVITVRLLVDHNTAKHSTGHLNHVAEMAKVAAERAVESYEVEVVGGEAFHGAATKEDCILFTPRKVHFIENAALFQRSLPICSEVKMISSRYLTKEWERVTCKNCLRKRPQPAQVGLFSGN